MASVANRFRMVEDFFCSKCEEENLKESADIYCEKCPKFYCKKCAQLHGQFYTKHTTWGSGEMEKWPVSKEVEDFLQKCEVHKDKKLKMFCEDHSQLCCTNCAFLNHRQCTQVAHISESVQMQPTDLQQMSAQIKIILEQMMNLQSNWDASKHSLQGSYNEHERQMVEYMHKKIRSFFVEFENNTVNEIHEHEQEEMRKKFCSVLVEFDHSVVKDLKDNLITLQSDIDKCIRLQDEMKQLQDALQHIYDKNRNELLFIARRKLLQKMQQFVTYLKVQTFTVQANPDQVFTVKGKSEYNVSIPSDSSKCHIAAICVLPDGQILVVDYHNKKLKLLDQQYRVLTHCDVSTNPCDICHITHSEVAVTVDDVNTHEIQFISVNNGQLVKCRKLQLQHRCRGIAHHQGELYVTDWTALYKYTLSGKLVSKLYEDTSHVDTVYRCAVSPTGDRIYSTNLWQHKLLTLARKGSVLSTLEDPELQVPYAVHVTPAGQVLVCGYDSKTIIQVDRVGRKKLATLATRRDGVWDPVSVCYNRHTASILVGQGDNNIVVLKVQ